jgi:Fic family protein
MKTRLSDVNPYLRDPAKRKRAMLKSVISSSAIEGIRVTPKDLRRVTAGLTDHLCLGRYLFESC